MLMMMSDKADNIDGFDRCADIRLGRIKSILQLFFNLSRYKQQQKFSTSSTRRRRTQSGSRSDGGGTVQLNNTHHSSAATHSVPVERRAAVPAQSSNVDVANGNVDMTSRSHITSVVHMFLLYYIIFFATNYKQTSSN